MASAQEIQEGGVSQRQPAQRQNSSSSEYPHNVFDDLPPQLKQQFHINNGVKHYDQRMEKQKKEQERKQHVFIKGQWDNSFDFESPVFQILIFLCVIIVAIAWKFTNYLDTPQKKIGVIAVVVLLYILDCSLNSIGKYSDNVMTIDEFQKYFSEQKKMKVSLKYKVEAFHFTKNTVNGRTEKTTNKVVSSKEEFNLPINKVKDITEDFLQYFNSVKCIRLHTISNYSYGDERSEKYFLAFKKYAEAKMSKKDEEYQVTELFEKQIDLKKNILIVHDKKQKDAMINRFVYFVYCSVGLCLLYRILLNRRVPILEFCQHKQIYVDPKKKLADYFDPNTYELIQPVEQKESTEASSSSQEERQKISKKKTN